jgi:hypothetical protein
MLRESASENAALGTDQGRRGSVRSKLLKAGPGASLISGSATRQTARASSHGPRQADGKCSSMERCVLNGCPIGLRWLMSLTDLYESAGPSIVGFISRMVQAPTNQPSSFPEIIGTGFLVTADGVVATNRHVVDALWRLPLIPGTNEPAGAAFIFMVSDDKLGGQILNLKIRDVAALQGRGSESDWYGQDVPDVGFVQLQITGMPFLELATEDFAIMPGMEIATMGYPMGTLPLVLLNKVNQLGPFIRRGIVSSVYPFSSAQPHGFTIDIMQQGGSSGSPIFAGDSPRVVGMMWGSVIEPRQAESASLSLTYTLNTNISICEPTDIIKDALTKYLSQRKPLEPSTLSLQQLREQYPRPENTTGFKWSMNPLDIA